MNGHIVIPHRSHFTWQRAALVISQDFVGLQFATLKSPATAVQAERERERETDSAKVQGQFMTLSHINFRLLSKSFVKVSHLDFGSRVNDLFHRE